MDEIAAIVPGDGSQDVRVDHGIVLYLKVMVYITSATFIHHIFHFIMFSSFHMERKAGIWMFHYRMSIITIHITLRRSPSFFGMLTGCMCVHQK